MTKEPTTAEAETLDPALIPDRLARLKRSRGKDEVRRCSRF